MRAIINLTRPLSTSTPNRSPAYYVPFGIESLLELDINGVRIDRFEFHTELGTRLLSPAVFNKAAKQLQDFPLAELVDRRVAIVRIPKAAGEVITEDEISKKVGEAEHYQPGDGLIIHTGWGDSDSPERDYTEHLNNGPSFTHGAARALAAIMGSNGTNLLGLDLSRLGSPQMVHMKEWMDLPDEARPFWPSDEARAFLETMTPEKVHEDYAPMQYLLRDSLLLLELHNLDQLQANVVRLTALTLPFADAVAAPATVVAYPA